MAELYSLLKTATAPAHARVENLPFFHALSDGALPAIATVSYLRALSVIHGVLERSLSESDDPHVRKMAALSARMTPLLAADLEACSSAGMPSISPALRAALNFGAEVLAKADDPLTLLGVLYVLEGSRNGGAVLRRSFARSVSGSGPALSYFASDGKSVRKSWVPFVEGLNALALTAGQEETIVRSAVSGFEWIEEICSALYPFSDDLLQHHVAAVNFEAGDHAMPEDPREIAIALLAGEEAWRSYPYLAARFGDRGRRFTSSDSCWLVSLTHLPPQTATKSLVWLRTVLASRGIPTVILQGHLARISRALEAEAGSGTPQCQTFDAFLAGLESERRVLGETGDLSAIEERFEARFESCRDVSVGAPAKLIVSAWIDEKSGISGALGATHSWLSDAERFSGDWVATAGDLVAELNSGGATGC